ncbi:SRPBCC domain-containing protein [Sphingobacterium sp. DK4209]|uniref:SRPBCC domain-containing protein n=1 Tax=Sphingobacterium zhuxiongii TaxID=2662364 RepID=A0A5Q0QC69_9SPHI|nr:MULTISPECIES: SRPBCC domain-containing protein [unclassified Sphingobacterium]MVZ64959.1 SRPBCC domain-containing protein [Sphingobacterium sp. DK4209]QGA25298.1 SRPBCC domain-containing protein [Sphingobacterium sp. dk4302]
MKEIIETHVLINKSAKAIWNILSDFKSYPSWSPTIRFFEGVPVVGKRRQVSLQQPGGTAIKMNPIFLKIDLNEELRWKGRLGLNGIFDGEHYFILKAISDQQTLLIQGEIFTGILVPFLKKMIHGNTLAGFEAFNQAIKERAEAVL